MKQRAHPKYGAHVLLLVVAVSLAGCLSWRATPIVEGRTGAAPDVRVVGVSDLGVIANPVGTQGRDGGHSAVFGGRVVWVFGDTIQSGVRENDSHEDAVPTAALDSELELSSNSWSWTTDFDASDGISGLKERRDRLGRPVELLPFTEEESAFNAAHREGDCGVPPCRTRWALWPGPVVPDPERDRALVFYARIYSEAGPLAFRAEGHSIAVWDRFDETATRPSIAQSDREATLLFGSEEPSFGSGAVAIGSTLYSFGCDLEGLQKPCRLGTVPLEHALERDKWRFWAGTGEWVSEPADSERLFDGNTILSVFQLPFADTFAALYSRPMTTAVVLRTAPRMEGPWSEELLLFQARPPDAEPAWVYDALVHPEYAEEDGRIQYVTYSRAIGPADFEMRLVRVEFELSGN